MNLLPLLIGLVLIILTGAILALRRRQAHRFDEQSIAAVWSYSCDGRTEWRWLCAADHVGEDGFASEEEAIVDAERAGYYIQK
jgi:hypothetical protein